MPFDEGPKQLDRRTWRRTHDVLLRCRPRRRTIRVVSPLQLGSTGLVQGPRSATTARVVPGLPSRRPAMMDRCDPAIREPPRGETSDMEEPRRAPPCGRRRRRPLWASRVSEKNPRRTRRSRRRLHRVCGRPGPINTASSMRWSGVSSHGRPFAEGTAGRTRPRV